ncbi:MAG: ribonuclease P protein component, partial [Armatimonadetes bacterium]|nr:ribonuclease P protein component [Armatimonadota bacterium]
GLSPSRVPTAEVPVLQKQHRLTRTRDFKATFAGGRTFVHRLIVLKVLDREDERPSRFGFVVSANLGKAVSRNRARRLLREAVRLLGDRVQPSGCDAVLIARRPAREADFAEASQAVELLFRKAGLLSDRRSAEERHESL